jgi:streptogrisin D
MRAQLPLLAAVARLEEAISRAARRTVGGITISVRDHRVRLYWKGSLPTSLARPVRRLSHDNVAVSVLGARYTRQQLLRYAHDLVRQARYFPGVHSVSPLPDGSGLEVGVAPGSPTAALRRLPVAARVRVEESFEPFQCKTGHFYCRRADTSPYWGGAVATPFNGGGCSDAFATISPWANLEVGPDGRPVFVHHKFMLTADHCGGGAGVNYFAGGAGLMGQGALVNRGVDSVAIRTQSAPRVYDGGVDDASEFSKPVVGIGNNVSGEFVCTSGAATGVHCGIQITSTGGSEKAADGHWIHDVVRADQVDGVLAAGAGDSGGPVFALSEDPSKVVGMGVILGGGKQADFPATCTYFSTKCSTRVLYVDLFEILVNQGLYLLITS